MISSNKENYADKWQKHNSKKGNKKATSAGNAKDEQADGSFPKSNLTAKKAFSYPVMGAGVQYKLISGISIIPDHSIGETGSPIWFRKITPRHTFCHAVMWISKAKVLWGGMICFIRSGSILRGG